MLEKRFIFAAVRDQHGVVTWSGYEDREQFDQWLASAAGYSLVEWNITPERAIQLAKATPARARYDHAWAAAIRKDGSFDVDAYGHEMFNAMGAVRASTR